MNHAISVSTTKLGRGYVWSYQIDGGNPPGQFADRPQSEEMALREGIGEARSAVDRMVKAK